MQIQTILLVFLVAKVHGLYDGNKCSPFQERNEKMGVTQMTFYQATSSSVLNDSKDVHGPQNLYDGVRKSHFHYDGGACFSTLPQQKSWVQLDSYEYMSIKEIYILNKFVDKPEVGANYNNIEGLKVKVCQDSTRKDCKLFETVSARTPNGGWIKWRKKCMMELKGATILLEHDTAIQICEIIVKGVKVPHTEMVFYNARSSGIFKDDNENYGPKNLYDGTVHANEYFLGCFHSEEISDSKTNEAWVAVDGKDAMYITRIYIVNRWDYYKTQARKIKGLRVEICQDSTLRVCEEFGRVNDYVGSVGYEEGEDWFIFERKSGMQLDRARTVLLKNNQTINLCELIVEGTKIPDTPMTFYNAQSSGMYINDEEMYGPKNLYDGDTRTDVDSGSCFRSENKFDSITNEIWVAFDSRATLYITKIDILNTNSNKQRLYNEIKGLKVKVCQDSSRKDCKLFGTVEETPDGGWITLRSNYQKKIKGATILLEHYTTIQICEIIVKGEKIPETEMDFYSAQSSGVYKDDSEMYGPENLFDGDFRTSMCYGGCFHSEDNLDPNTNEAWVVLNSKEAMYITDVYILNRYDNRRQIYERTKELRVETCQDSSKKLCERFGTVKNAPNGKWIRLSRTGDERLDRTTTVVLKNSKIINICEVVVEGIILPETQMSFYNGGSSAVYDDYDYIEIFGPETLYDRDTRTNIASGGCFLSAHMLDIYWKNGFVDGIYTGHKIDWAALDSRDSVYITHIWLLYSHNFYVLEHERGVNEELKVEVCPNSTKEGCEEFGTVKVLPKGKWVRLSRKTDMRLESARTILLKNHSLIYLCELIVEGRKLPETRMKFSNAQSSGMYKDDSHTYGPKKLFDGDTRTDADSGGCFHSESLLDSNTNEAWVELDSEDAYYITKIYLLNRYSAVEDVYERIKGLRVEVCPNSTKTDCAVFGTVKDTPNGDWVELSRENEMRKEGEMTVLLKHNQSISICEVIVNATKIPQCDECTQELVKRGEKYVCEARVRGSPFMPVGPCKCECGEGEQMETRTCSLFDNDEGNCIEKKFESVPEDPTHACAQFKFNRTIKCECNRNTGWVDEYADVGECQYGPDYLCGSCLEGFQRQLKKCNALVKNGSECNTVETGDPSLCGLDQPQRNIPCKFSNHENAITCKVDRLIVYTWDAEGSGTNDNLYFFAYDGFKPIMLHESRFLFSGENYCYLGSSNLPNHKATERGTTTVYTNLTVYNNRLCLYQKSFTKMTVKIDGNDDWRGNVSVEVNGVLQGYSNGFQSLSSSSFLPYWRVE